MTRVQVVNTANGFSVNLVLDQYELSSADFSASQELTPGEAERIAGALLQMADRVRQLENARV